MNKQLNRYLQLTLILMDLGMLNLCFIIPGLLFRERIPYTYTKAYLSLFLFLNTLWVILSFLSGNYVEKIIIQFESFTKRTLQVYLLWMILIFLYLFFSRDTQISRLFIITFVFSFAITLMTNRFLYLGIRNYFKSKGQFNNKVLILGYNETADKLATYFEQEGWNTSLIGFAEDSEKIEELTRYPVICGIEQTVIFAKEQEVNEIYSTISPEENKYIYQLIEMAEKECIRFKVVPNLSHFFSKQVVVDYFGDLPILSMRSEPLEDVGNRLKKRILDVAISFCVVIFILSWLVPLLALLIKLESRGPVFFKQKRTGKNNLPFNCLKFRSMKMNTHADSKQATKNDARVTRIGKFLRKTSLDEFPQFINVLKGEMSLVGPRPHMVKHTDDYSKIVDQYMIRHFLKPGITGWAQINGYRGEITEPRQIKLRVQNDLWYLENWNIWLDIKILFLTVYTIFRGDKNAY